MSEKPSVDDLAQEAVERIRLMEKELGMRPSAEVLRGIIKAAIVRALDENTSPVTAVAARPPG